MPLQEFTIHLVGIAIDEAPDLLYESGFDDCLVRTCDAKLFVDFAREDENLAVAISKAVGDLEKIGGSGFRITSEGKRLLNEIDFDDIQIGDRIISALGNPGTVVGKKREGTRDDPGPRFDEIRLKIAGRDLINPAFHMNLDRVEYLGRPDAED